MKTSNPKLFGLTTMVYFSLLGCVSTAEISVSSLSTPGPIAFMSTAPSLPLSIRGVSCLSHPDSDCPSATPQGSECTPIDAYRISGKANTPTSVYISGTNFDPGTRFEIGGNQCSSTFLSSSCVRCTFQSASWGLNAVNALNAQGQVALPSPNPLLVNIQDIPPTISGMNFRVGPTTGGTNLIISGSHFLPGARVTLGPTVGQNDGEFTCTSVSYFLPNTIICVTPPHKAGVVDVKVTNPDGTPPAKLAAAFTFVPPTVAPYGLTYKYSPAWYPLSYASPSPTPIASNTPAFFGTQSPLPTYSVLPALPSGLTLNPNTGVISGVPASPIASSIYTITATNVAGSTTANLILGITDFGSGRSGSTTLSGTSVVNYYGRVTNASLPSGSTSINVTPDPVSSFAPGDQILVIQMQGTATPSWEYATVSPTWSPSPSWSSLPLASGLVNSYQSGTAPQVTQIVRVPQFRDLTINPGASVTAPFWNGQTGGVIAFRVNGTLTVNGNINAAGKGFRGGAAAAVNAGAGFAGESYLGVGTASSTANSGGGGGGNGTSASSSGGGGGHGTAGGTGVSFNGSYTYNGGAGGNSVPADMTRFFLGSGGGGPSTTGSQCVPPPGSPGGGMILITAYNLQLGPLGTISANGANSLGDGANCGGDSGGAGAGGTIYLKSATLNIGNNQVTALGGSSDYFSGIAQGGAGGNGRIRMDYGVLVGAPNPQPSSVNPI